LEKITDFQLLKTKAYEIIKKNIINLTFHPNQQLIERRLSAELGVSTSPIREALHRLEGEGLVYTQHFKGCFVAGISEKEIKEVFQLRKALETECFKYACEIFTNEEINKVSQILCKAEEALHRGDLDQCYAANIQFHEFFIFNSKNSKIIQAYLTTRDHLDRYRNLVSRILGRVAKSHKEHLLVMKGLEQKNARQVEKRISEHLDSVLDEFLRSIVSGNGGEILYCDLKEMDEYKKMKIFNGKINYDRKC
jgi:DNA-binding GntR family transcriptional regulator